MITRGTRLKIGAFVLVALLGISYVSATYVGLFKSASTVVTMQLADSGGIFTNAEVTYRGVTIGRVGQLRLTSDGIEVDLELDSDAPRVPAETEAVVANRSAVGEQYVDLRPKSDGAPYLEAGSVIPRSATKTPPPVDGLLSNLDAFVQIGRLCQASLTQIRASSSRGGTLVVLKLLFIYKIVLKHF